MARKGSNAAEGATQEGTQGKERLLFPLNASSGWSMVVALGCTTMLSYGTTWYLFGVLEVPLAQTFSWSRTQLSGAYALSLLIAGFLGVPVGYLIDRYGARALMTIGSALAGCALLGLSQITSVFQFYLYWSGGLGVAMALLLYPVTFTVITSWFAAAQRTRAFALLTLLGGLASPIFIPLTGWLIPLVGWRTALVWYALLHLTVALPLHGWLVRRVPDDSHDLVSRTPDAEGASHDSSPVRQALVRLRFWVLTGASALALLGSAIVFAHQIAYLLSRGYDSFLAVTVAGALGLTSVLGRFLLNLLGTRVLPQTVLVGTLLVQACGVLVLMLAPSAPWLLLYVLLYGAAFGLLLPLQAQVMVDHFGKRAYGAITGVQGMPLAICQAAGPLVAGWLYDQLHHYDLAFWLCVGSFIVSALLILGLPQPGRRQKGRGET